MSVRTAQTIELMDSNLAGLYFDEISQFLSV